MPADELEDEMRDWLEVCEALRPMIDTINPIFTSAFQFAYARAADATKAWFESQLKRQKESSK